jgi:hypothetical protein
MTPCTQRAPPSKKAGVAAKREAQALLKQADKHTPWQEAVAEEATTEQDKRKPSKEVPAASLKQPPLRSLPHRQ